MMPVQSLVPTSVHNSVICRTSLVKSKNRMTDFQRLRRNGLREIHDHSAPHRMLFSYEKWSRARLRYGIHFCWLHNAKGVGLGPIQVIRDCSFSFESLRSLLRK